MRGQETEQEGSTQKISFQPVGKMIGNPGMSVDVHEVWIKNIKTGEERVTELPTGTDFYIKIDYTSSWPEGSVSLINPWTVIFTAIDLTGKHYSLGKTVTFSSPHREVLVIPDPQALFVYHFVMPDFAPIFRIRPWGHPDWEPLSYPPVDAW